MAQRTTRKAAGKHPRRKRSTANSRGRSRSRSSPRSQQRKISDIGATSWNPERQAWPSEGREPLSEEE